MICIASCVLVHLASNNDQVGHYISSDPSSRANAKCEKFSVSSTPDVTFCAKQAAAQAASSDD